MYFDRNFVEGLKEKRELNGVTTEQLKEFGYLNYQEIVYNRDTQEIKIEIYTLDHKTYLLKFVDGECMQFIDITTK